MSLQVQLLIQVKMPVHASVVEDVGRRSVVGSGEEDGIGTVVGSGEDVGTGSVVGSGEYVGR
ncbi:hypothetical protein DPMN_050537 [Dreissena polymorpha]|uniref:Uncharacterized protein n=1 Tax=Dreissena polymorpha TaxID=45954 RepID=A0A9D4CGB2_DREPO|nr:hypothetical protein DPMN_050537 [Dreissena polymorpha]